ncbi:MAG: hypothetical protein ABH821_01835 [archaeon]
MSLIEREKQVFLALEKIKNNEFVVIGGYAINAFTIPRFSVDCDIVVKSVSESTKVIRKLKEIGFKERKDVRRLYGEKFVTLRTENKTSFDILISEVSDRKTEKVIPAKTVFENSNKRIVYGKGSPTKIKTNVINPELLVLMKTISSRKTDIRDIFMLHTIKIDKKKLLNLIKEIGVPAKSIQTVKETITSKQFKDSIAGVYGNIQEEVFKNTLKKTLKTLKETSKITNKKEVKDSYIKKIHKIEKKHLKKYGYKTQSISELTKEIEKQ